ncbi:MAG: hypothetical protein QM765_16350 [Myxococcales bacterium]
MSAGPMTPTEKLAAWQELLDQDVAVARQASAANRGGELGRAGHHAPTVDAERAVALPWLDDHREGERRGIDQVLARVDPARRHGHVATGQGSADAGLVDGEQVRVHRAARERDPEVLQQRGGAGPDRAVDAGPVAEVDHGVDRLQSGGQVRQVVERGAVEADVMAELSQQAGNGLDRGLVLIGQVVRGDSAADAARVAVQNRQTHVASWWRIRRTKT